MDDAEGWKKEGFLLVVPLASREIEMQAHAYRRIWGWEIESDVRKKQKHKQEASHLA